MLVRPVTENEKENFNQVIKHPLQSWEWGEFKQKTGVEVVRLGVFKKNQLVNGCQLTVHPIPKLNLTVIYFPKGPMPDKQMLSALKELGKDKRAVFVRLEPNIGHPVSETIKSQFKESRRLLLGNNCRCGRPLFTPYTLQLDLTQPKEKLLEKMKSKTRYNIRLAQKRGVKVIHDNSNEAFEQYLNLLSKTTKRQEFYAHTPDYFKKMWSVLKPAGIAHLLLAKYQGKTLAAWIVFVHKDILYYPYGASSREYKEVMASSALMWKAIKFGQEKNCRIFDLWGSLGPDPDKNHPWFGFHRFKLGFRPQLVKFIGTYDLVVNPLLYPFVRLAESLRWKLLRLKVKLSF